MKDIRVVLSLEDFGWTADGYQHGTVVWWPPAFVKTHPPHFYFSLLVSTHSYANLISFFSLETELCYSQQRYNQSVEASWHQSDVWSLRVSQQKAHIHQDWKSQLHEYLNYGPRAISVWQCCLIETFGRDGGSAIVLNKWRKIQNVGISLPSWALNISFSWAESFSNTQISEVVRQRQLKVP